MEKSAEALYSEIQSAIYLPQGSSNANEFVVQVIDNICKDKLKGFYEQDKGTIMLPAILEMQQVEINGCISIEELLSGVLSELSVKDTNEKKMELAPELKLRFEEYSYILKGRESENSDLKAIVKNFEEYEDKDLLEKYSVGFG